MPKQSTLDKNVFTMYMILNVLTYSDIVAIWLVGPAQEAIHIKYSRSNADYEILLPKQSCNIVECTTYSCCQLVMSTTVKQFKNEFAA